VLRGRRLSKMVSLGGQWITSVQTRNANQSLASLDEFSGAV